MTCSISLFTECTSSCGKTFYSTLGKNPTSHKHFAQSSNTDSYTHLSSSNTNSYLSFFFFVQVCYEGWFVETIVFTLIQISSRETMNDCTSHFTHYRGSNRITFSVVVMDRL